MRRRALLLTVVAMALAGPSWAGKKPVKKEPARSELPEFKGPSMEERQAVFGEIDEAFKAGQKARVADLLVEVVDNPEHQAFHAEAYARLAAMLDQLDLPYAALIAYERALATDAPGVSSIAKDAIRLADDVGDTELLEHVFSANVGLDVDPATRSRMAYLAARESHHRGKYGTALAILKMVNAEDPFYPEAKSLEGVVLSLQGRHNDALAPLLVAQQVGRERGREQRFDELVNLNLARAYYGAENHPRAIEYYAQVDRTSVYWPEAEFERAWAHFRLQDMNGTLGLLQDHVSPYFTDFYFPEASLLRVYALFLMCKFPDASKAIDEFQAQYRPQAGELADLATRSPEDLFDQMARHVLATKTGKKHESQLPPMLTRPFDNDDRFHDSLTAIQHAEDELSRLKNVSANPFSERAGQWVTERRDAIIKAEGRRIADRVDGMNAQLDQFLADSEMSKLDMMQFETRLYEMASVEGAAPEARRIISRGMKVKPSQRHWQWEGEYWADEIGYFRFLSKPECPAGLTPGG